MHQDTIAGDGGRLITVPLRATVGATHAVYFPPSRTRPPSGASLAASITSWRDRHLSDPLKSAVAAFHDRGLVTVGVGSVDRSMAPPVALLRASGLGELEERVLGAATQAVLISCADVNTPPGVGLWATLAAALAVGRRVRGVIVDPDALRVVSSGAAVGWFTEHGAVAAQQHIVIRFSVRPDDGLGWMTTLGLRKFGLPDVELRDVPPNLHVLRRLMNGVAQFLIEAALRHPTARAGRPSVLRIDEEIEVDPALLDRAEGRAADPARAQRSSIRLGIRFDLSERAPSPAMIRVLPPAGQDDSGVWLTEVGRELHGATDEIVEMCTFHAPMQRAHRRAKAELPEVRRRFQAGLQPGQVLYVKRGFATPAGSLEYLWVVVSKWSRSLVVGQVTNQPRDVPSVRQGQTVTIREAEIFDWLMEYPDGFSSGGYTNKVLDRYR
jgi:uncharacterized protein YegJ (DUF2314 family)